MRSLYITTILLFFFVNAIHPQSPHWAWAKSGGASTIGQGTNICTDAGGNSYVTGQFNDTISFGSNTLINDNSQNVFLVKYDPSGNVIWASGTKGNGGSFPGGICTDASGNVYVTGCFSGDSITFGNFALINAGTGQNVFVAKYNSSGTPLWAVSARGVGNSYDVGSSISSDADGNVYITGSFGSTIIVFGNDTLRSNSSQSFFIAKYDSVGNELWVKSGGCYYGAAYGQGIKTDVGGNSYVTGSFEGPYIALGADTLTTIGINVFIAKYDPFGNLIWAKSSNGVGTNLPSGISIDASGNAYVTGFFDSVMMTFGTDTITNKGVQSVFIAKYDASGNVVWAKSAGGAGSGNGQAISTDANGNSYIIGFYDSTNIVFGSDTLVNAGIQNFFIVKYDASGNVIWAKSAGGTSIDYGNGISEDPVGNVYITGGYVSPFIDFGADTLTNMGSFYYNVFVAKLGNITSGITSINQSNKITIYPNPSTGTFYFSGVQTGSGIDVYNLMGEKIYTTQASTDNATINLDGWPKGMYLYKISNSAIPVQQGKIVLE